ncbi:MULTISPECIES: AAA family ATPase [Providencia]|uniref:TnsC family transposon Tn7 transposition protein n=1 Tax=Providencia heimbachae ATCC 35613 TaxID=1354272 RepID=A0A1B7JUH2_9GAMM|nr:MULTISPECIES: AAA family ATPase [Providencia]OAT51553.1 TnsC family transposon Tn7 transposition protein [Providencia heimbachae ATCC 35613]SQH11393.1 Transposon Tn7 transposition protein tnsC [Providencia heimbachae]
MEQPNHFVIASYQSTGIKRYDGNPFIEALPPILSVAQAGNSIKGKVDFHPSDRLSSPKSRMHMAVSLLDDYFQPLSQHVLLQEKIDMMLRMGYVGRNISDGSLNRKLQEGYDLIKSGGEITANFSVEKTTARSMSLVGISGSGKTSSLIRVLETYPQVIYHEQQNFFQVTYLKIECPSNGDLESLCLNFFSAVDGVLGTDYERRYAKQRLSVPKMLALMRQTANNRAIGILVIDEIQRLSQVRSGGKEQMLEFFVELVNTVGIPIVLVGTPKARPIFELELQSGRRSAGLGSIYWETIQQNVDKSSGKVPNLNWTRFSDNLWKHQWLKHGDDPLTDEIRDCWYDLSQGVLDIVVKLFVLAQLRAIANKKERITVGILKSVYKQELKPVHPMLDALRSGDADKIVKYSDMRVVDLDKRLIQLGSEIMEVVQKQEERLFGGNQEALRLYNVILQIEENFDEQNVVKLVERIFEEHPGQSIHEMIPILVNWYQSYEEPVRKEKTKTKVKQKDWHDLDVSDLRYQYAYCKEERLSLVERLEQNGQMFDLDSWAAGF